MCYASIVGQDKLLQKLNANNGTHKCRQKMCIAYHFFCCFFFQSVTVYYLCTRFFLYSSSVKSVLLLPSALPQNVHISHPSQSNDSWMKLTKMYAHFITMYIYKNLLLNRHTHTSHAYTACIHITDV